MLVLGCTRKLLAKLKQSDPFPPVESTTRLGDWYGNVLQLGRRQFLLFISEHSRLPVILPISEGKRLATVLPDAICQALARITHERSRVRSQCAGGPTLEMPPVSTPRAARCSRRRPGEP